MQNCYLDDFVAGQSVITAAETLSEEEILDFANAYDPQPFHTDPEYAAASPFGGLIASGVQTLGIAVRLIMKSRIFARDASLGSPGLDELRWRVPVRPGDTLRARFEVLETRPSRSKPDRGILRYAFAVLNQDDEVVMTALGTQIVRRGPAGN